MADARKLDLDLIREIYDAWNRGEVEATLAYVHPEVEWHTRWMGEAEVYRGRAGLVIMRRVFYELDEALSCFSNQ